MTEKRKPWAKWYWGDWRADPKLRLCNLQARGLWAEMIALMQEAHPYGHLLVEGMAPTIDELATLAGAPVKVVAQAQADLERRGVFSRTPDGVIYSRRMVRDKAKEIQDQTNGKGGGNPKLKNGDKGGVNPPDKAPDNTPDKAQRLEARDQKEETEANASVANAPDQISDAVEAFNAVAKACGLPKAQSITPKRRAGIKARMKECGGIDGWRQACELIREHPWMHGANEKGWRLSLDDLVTPKIFTKLMEGAYERSSKATGQSRSGVSGQRSGAQGSASLSRIAMELRAAGGEQRLRDDGVPPNGADHGGSTSGDPFPFEGFDAAWGQGTGHLRTDHVPLDDQEPTEGRRRHEADDGRLHGGVIEIPG